MSQNQFNPASVPITFTLNFQQVNLLLKAMSKLPREETDGFYEQFRALALQTLQDAEAAHGKEADVANEAASSDAESPNP